MNKFRDDRPALSINDRIVWISDNGPEYGNVRWLGKLPDLGHEWMAGVEFDNPVGSGTGLYKDSQLFETDLNHASLVPIIGLIKASDFDDLAPKSHTSSNNRNKTSYNNEHSKYNHVRNIPIHCETDKHKSKQVKDQAPPLPEKPDKYVHRPTDPISDITSNLKRTNLNELTEILPKPSFVVDPYDLNSKDNLKNLFGKSKGIQGYKNSCYLDSTLFAMFASNTFFDSLLYRPKRKVGDVLAYNEVQRILRDEIVKPLRNDRFVSADKVMKFRQQLHNSCYEDGYTDQEKDPEEFLKLLLVDILKVEPYVKLTTDYASYYHQIIFEKDEKIILPTYQDLFDRSVMNSTVRWREIPSFLFLMMPRCGKQYRMYPRIIPSLRLDITDYIVNAARPCGLRLKDCDNLARYECKDCYEEQPGGHSIRISSVTSCFQCFRAKHFGKTHTTGIESHDKTKKQLKETSEEAILRYSIREGEASDNSKNREIPRIYMDLLAILCIETSHFVCFVRCGDELDSPWCFFDSMADRRGERDGYNIPEVVQFDEFAFWTSEKGVACLLNNRDDKQLPEMAKRLICDSYLCFYQYKGLKPFR